MPVASGSSPAPRLLGAALSCALLLAPAMALAAPRIEYHVLDDCPDAQWFEAEMREQGVSLEADAWLRVEVRRVPQTPLEAEKALEAETPPQANGPLEAEATADAGPALLGQLSYQAYGQTLNPRSGSKAPPVFDFRRELRGDSCEELLSGLALSFTVHLEEQEEANYGTPPSLFDEPLPPPVDPAWVQILDYEASARWRLGLILGLAVRGGLALDATAAWTTGLHLRAVSEGWGSGPFELGFSQMIGPRRASVPSATLPRRYWDQHYWVVHALLTPWTSSPYEGLRLGPALALNGGRFGARLEGTPDPPDREIWFAFGELLCVGELHRGPALVRLHMGFQFPLDRYSFTTPSGEVYRQDPGLVLGLGLGWSGVLL